MVEEELAHIANNHLPQRGEVEIASENREQFRVGGLQR
jgi:hypothetical protein